MLQLFHKYFKSTLLMIVAIAVVFSMLFFGTGSSLSPKGWAMKINDTEISNEDYFSYQQAMEARLRQTFGAAYTQFFTPEVLREQVNDMIIKNTLLKQFTDKLGLEVGAKEFQNILTKQFQGNKNAYIGFLAASRLSAKQYEDRLAGDIKASLIPTLFEDFSLAVKSEIDAQLQQSEKSLNINIAEYKPEDFANKITAPTKEEIEKYYNENGSDFEEPKSVKYNFVALDPEKNLNLVEIQDADIEVAYADNIASYTTLEQAKVSQIKISIPKDDAIKITEKNNLANDVAKKAEAGEDFEKLVKAHSEDETSKKANGSIGWIKRNQLDNGLDNAIFSLKKLGIVGPISTADAIYIFRVEEYKPETTTPLEKVKEQIKVDLQKQEAPAVILAKASDYLTTWKNSDKKLKDFATDNSLPYSEGDSAKFLTASQDPESHKGLTKQVLDNITEDKGIVELGNLVYLVELSDQKEAAIPPLPVVESKIIETLNKKAIALTVKTESEKALADIKAKKINFADFFKESKTTLKNIADVKKSTTATEAPLSDPTLREDLFTKLDTGLLPKAYKINNSYFLINLEKITLADPSKADEKAIKTAKDTAENANRQALLDTLINQLKLESEIKIAPGFSAS